MIRLIEEESGKVLSLSYPPRNDLAQRIEWDLAAHAGKSVRIELVDGDAGDAYAWLAAGRFEPGVVPFPKVSPNQTAQQQQQAAGLVRSLALSDLETDLIRLLNSGTDLETAASFTGALAALQATPTRVAVATLVADTALPIASRQRLSQRPAAGGADSLDSVVVEAVRAAPLRTQVRLAQALAATRTGAAALFQLVESGSCLPRVLLDRTVRDKIQSVDPVLGARIMALTKGLTPVNADVEKLIERRRADYRPQAAKAERGAQVFNQSCAACHQMGGQGQLVGPQLDGIGNRGLERLLEDILDPNRNVDHAFRSHTFTMKDGEVISGLPRREEGELLILADSTGKEISIPKKQIEARRESETSLMPENFGDVLSGADLDHLLTFLFSSSASSAR
jgi:putative heme-binding domain-containing protein